MDLIHIYDTVTGRRLGSLPASSWKWSRQISGPGSLSVEITYSDEVRGRDLRTELAPWRTTLAVVDQVTHRVVAAGIVYQRRWDEDAYKLEVSCADVWSIFKLRLVMPHVLDSYEHGMIVGEDGAYPSPWTLTYTGSLGDIARDLVASTLQLGPLPIVLPPTEGGSAQRTWQVPDFATIASRLEDLTRVISGPEIIFQPRLVDGTTSLVWHMLIGDPELHVETHTWDLRRRATPLIKISVDEDASDMISDSWARGGSHEDATLIAHHHDRWLEEAGWPLLQGADTSHSTVSEIKTLSDYARSATIMRSRSTEVVSVQVRRLDEAGYQLGDKVVPGDHISLRVDSPYLGSKVLRLKVLELTGDASEWITVSCREIIDEESP